MKKTSLDSTQVVSQLATAIDKAYSRIPNLMWRSFLSGLFTALGATIGLALVGTLLGVFLRTLGGLPVIGHYINDLGTTVSQKK